MTDPTTSTTTAKASFPPGPNLLGSARRLASFFDDPVRFYTELREGWGDVVGVRLGGLRMAMLFDLDHIRTFFMEAGEDLRKGKGLRVLRPVVGEGLLTADNEPHRRHRAIMQPAFQPRNLRPYAERMVRHALEQGARWTPGEEIDVHHATMRISLDVAATTMFGTTLDEQRRHSVEQAVESINRGYRMLVGPGGETIMRLRLTPAARRIVRARELLDSIIHDLISARRRGDIGELRDMLMLLLEANDLAGEADRLNDVQLHDEAITLLAAGHETVAASMAWTFATLGEHPEVEQRLFDELGQVLGGRDPGSDDVQRLPYTRAVIAESMRLRPSVYSTVREPLRPVRVGNWVLGPGTDVVLPISGIHRDPRWYDEPERFDPQRFMPGANPERPKLAYLPFGIGRRACIGASFAWQEMILVVATLVQRYSFELRAGHRVEAEALFTLHPKGGLPMVVRPRR